MRASLLIALPFCAAPLVLAAPPAMGEERPAWAAMSGAQITATLTGRRVQYATAWQEFRASGRTLYHSGADSWGYWAVRGDRYCSMWPPSDIWACYHMAQRGTQLRFIGAAGDTTDGRLAD